MRKTDREIQQKNGAVKICNAAQVVRNKGIINKTTYSYIEGKGFYHYEGKVIPEAEFLAMFPTIGKPFAIKGKNYDRTKNWLFDEKSF